MDNNRIYINEKDGSELAYVAGGYFWMGSGPEDGVAYDDEKPRHLHLVAPFQIGVTCVTV